MVTVMLLSLVNNEKNTLGLQAIFMTMRMRRCNLYAPNRAQPGLHAEPLNVSIGLLFAPYCPGVRHGHRRR